MASARPLLMAWCPVCAWFALCWSCSCSGACGARAGNFGCGGDCSTSANRVEGRKRQHDAGGQGERSYQNVGDREDHIGGGGLLGFDFLDYRPVRGDAQQELGADEGREEDAPAAQLFYGAEADADGAAGPDGEEQDDGGADHVGKNSEGAVAEART